MSDKTGCNHCMADQQVKELAAEKVWPSTALDLMRSRFEAFKRGDVQWLLESWHPSTRPASLDLTDNPQWKGLQIVEVIGGEPGQSSGVVEFRATYRGKSGVEVLHERSRFRCEGERWYYVDGHTLR